MKNYAKSMSVILGFLVAAAVLTAPGSADEHEEEHLTVPFTPIASVYSEDFAVDEGGFTTGGTSTWEFGNPQSPPAILEGQTPNVWGTHLTSDYGANECGYVQSPAIDLSDYPAVPGEGLTLARLSFEHWIHAEMSTSSDTAWDGGIVMVSTDGEDFTTIDPIGGYDSDGVFSSIRTCFDVGSDQSVYSTPRSPATAEDDWNMAEFDVTEFLGGDLHVRWAFASDSSVHSRGWYIDDIGVQVGVGASVELAEIPDLPDPDDPLPPLGAQAPGWTTGGDDPSWEYGTVTDDSSNAANIQGEVGYMTNLDGSTNRPECGYIQSPPIPGALIAGDPTLSFEHWYRIPGAFVDVAWGGGLVMVSGDGGLTWDYMDLPEYDRPLDYIGGNPECFTDFGAPIDGNVFSGANTQLHTVDVDLSDYVDAPSVQVRFIYGSVTFAYEGWFINQVELGGIPLLP